MLEADFILKLWLGIVPEHTVNFIRLTLITSLLEAFINPMFTANLASGKLNMYYIPVSIVSFFFMFITYFTIKITGIPESVFICLFIMVFLGFLLRIYIIKKQVCLPSTIYFKTVLAPVFLVTIFSIIIPLICHKLIENDTARLLLTVFASLISITFFSYYLGTMKSERTIIRNYIYDKLTKLLIKN